MVPHIQPSVEEIVDSPTEGERVPLAIVVQEGTEAGVISEVRNAGGDVSNQHAGGVLTVIMPETQVWRLCELDVVRSVSQDNDLRVLH